LSEIDVKSKMKNSKIKDSLNALLFPLISVFLSLFIAVFFVMWAKKYSITDYFTALSDLMSIIVSSSFGSMQQILDTSVYVVLLIFTGLANAIANRCGLFNIGAEGQFTMGFLAASLIGLIPGLSVWIHIPLIIIGGLMVGGLWASLPGYLKAKFGINEVINTIMINYIAMYVVNMVIMETHFGVKNKACTPIIQESAQLFRFISDSRANIGIIFALIAVVLVYLLMSKTTLGYEIRAVGSNPFAAEYGGINIKSKMILAMFISGAVSGIGGALHLSGTMYQSSSMTSFIGYGFDGIAVALLAKNNPIGCIPAAILFGVLENSSRILQLNNIPKEVVSLIEAIIIIFVSTDYVLKYIKRKKEIKGV